jgi:hypothetical protein
VAENRLSALERNFVIALSAVAAAAVIWFGYRVTLGEPPEAEPMAAFPVMHSTAIITGPGGHAYQYVAATNLTWETARDAAAQLSWHGQHGYLATIDSKAEFNFIIETVFRKQYPDVTYIGGRQTAPQEWRWVTGPDAIDDNGQGRLFWIGDEKGAAHAGYVDWMYTAFDHGGKWDARKVCCATLFSYRRPQFSTSLGNGDHDEGVSGYLVEFGR